MTVLNEKELVGIYNMTKHLNDDPNSLVSFRVKVYDSVGDQVGTIHQDEGEYMFDNEEVDD